MKARNILVLLTLLAVCAVALLIDRIDCDADRGQPGASRTLFEDLDAAIRTLRIEPADGQAIEIVLDGEAARLVEPVSAPANAEKATSLVELLKTLSYTRAFAPAAEEGLGDPQTGLDQPRLDVSFTDADGKQYRLLIGREAPTLGTGIVETYVRPARSGRTFVVAQDLAATFSADPTDYRDLTMLSVPVERAKLLRVEGRHTWTVQTSDDGWAVTDPGAGKAITRTVTGLLRKLDGLQAQRVLAEAPDDLRDYGLDKPQLVVTVTVAPAASDTDEATDDEPTTHTLLLGNVRQDSICATLKDRPTVFLLPKSMLDSLNPGLDEVRSDDLLEFDPEAIAAITVERAGGKTLKLVRDGETWTIRAPLSGPAETAAVEDLLRKASSLQADDWLTLAGDFEIDSPMATLTMEPEDETLAAVTLTIGGKSPGEPRNVVRSSQAPAPALVTLAKLEPLLAGAEAYWPTQLTEIGPDERIAAMTLNRPDETVQLKRLAGGYWRLTSPVEADADMDGITRMTRTLGDLSAAEILYVGETLSGRFSDAAQQIAATLTVEPTGEAGDDAGPRTVTLHVARLDDEEIAWIQRDGLWTVGRSENLWNLLSAELRQQEAAETDAPEADAGDPDAPALFAPAPPMP